MTWQKATACDVGATCVWVDITDDAVLMQGDDPDGPMLQFTHAEWAAFVAGARAGEFDVPTVQP